MYCHEPAETEQECDNCKIPGALDFFLEAFLNNQEKRGRTRRERRHDAAAQGPGSGANGRWIPRRGAGAEPSRAPAAGARREIERGRAPESGGGGADRPSTLGW